MNDELTLTVNRHTVQILSGHHSYGFYRASVRIDGVATVQVYSSASPDAQEEWNRNHWRIALSHPAVIKALNA